MIFVTFAIRLLEVGRRVNWARRMVLVQGILEWTVARGCAGLLVVGIRIIHIIFIRALLLAIHPPNSEGNSTKQDSTAHAANNAADCLLG